VLFSWPEFEYGRPALTWAEEFLTAHSTKATTEDGMEGFPCLPSELQGWVSRCLGYLGFFQGTTLSFSIDSITYSTGHMIGLVWRCVLKPFWDFFWNWNLYDFYRFLYDFYMISICFLYDFYMISIWFLYDAFVHNWIQLGTASASRGLRHTPLECYLSAGDAPVIFGRLVPWSDLMNVVFIYIYIYV